MLKIGEMFDKIALEYDFLNNLISFCLHKYVKSKSLSLLKIKENSKILDICTGTGDITKILKEKYKTFDIVGVDVSSNMLEIAKKKNPEITYILADVKNLPFPNSIFDYVISSFGYRNILDKKSAISEIKRVLKREGKFLHLDFGSFFFEPVYNIYLLVTAKIFSKNFDAYKYLVQSRKKFLKENYIKEFENNGFVVKTKKSFFFGAILCIIFEK